MNERFPHLLKTRSIATDAFVAPSADILGAVTLSSQSSVWFGCVLRGDVEEIYVGERSNIQDRTTIHSATGGPGTFLGNAVTVGHGCVLHACRLENWSFVGMGAICMDRSIVSSHAMLAAGTLLPPDKVVPEGQLWGGSPAKYLRDLRPEELENFESVCERYIALSRRHLSLNQGKS